MIVTVFRSRLRPEALAEYEPMAARMTELARRVPGFIAIKTFAAPDGERVSIIEFENERALAAWRNHPEHVEAQRVGRQRFYAEYRIETCKSLRSTRFLAE